MDEPKLKPHIMVPFCIWHNINKGENTYLSFIEQAIVNSKGEVVYKPYYNDWKLYGTFWAFSRDFIPIPPRTKIISIKNKNAYPYNIDSVSIDFDPYYQTDNTQFVAYVEGVQNTKILYFHTVKYGVFANFEIDPPYKYSGSIIKRPLAIYVTDKPYSTFACIDGSCQPSSVGSEANSVGSDKPMIDCIYSCKSIEHNFSFMNPEEKSYNKTYKSKKPNLLGHDHTVDDNELKVFSIKFSIIVAILFLIILLLIIKLFHSA